MYQKAINLIDTGGVMPVAEVLEAYGGTEIEWVYRY